MKNYIIRCGDALGLISELEPESIDAVIVDPPFCSGGTTAASRSRTAHEKYASTGASTQKLGRFQGDSRDQRSFQHWCALWYGQCYRAAKRHAVLLTFTDWRQLPATTDSVQAGGWTWRGIVPWNKRRGRPNKGGFRAQCEYVVFATKGANKPRKDAPYMPGILDVAAVSNKVRQHITQKPVALMEELLRLVRPGGVVLDPFAGSGTTGVACLRTGHTPVLFEIDEYNAGLIEARVKEELRCSDR